MTDNYDYFNRCEHCVHFKSYCFDEYDSDCYCLVFDEFKYEDCEKYEKRSNDE